MSNKESTGRYRNWVFTINNPDKYVSQDLFSEDNDAKQIVDYTTKEWDEIKSRSTYILCQLERGENGTPHLQGYIELKNASRLSTLKVCLPTAHLEPRRGTQKEAIDYCTKSDTREAGPFHWGEKRSQGARSDIKEIVDLTMQGKTLLEIISEYPHALQFINQIEKLQSRIKPAKRELPRIIWLWGPSGAGKTKAAWEIFSDAYLFVESTKGTTQWFEGYGGEKNFIWDEFSGAFPFRSLLQLIDVHPYRAQIKGSSCPINACNFIITSNSCPESFYSEELDRSPLERRLREWALVGRYFDRGNEQRGGGGRIGLGRYESQEEAEDITYDELITKAKRYFIRDE